MEGNDFYLTAPSDASVLRHPANHGGQYTLELPTTLHVNAHSWEVGLSEIIFHQNWRPFISSDIWAGVCINDATGGTWSQCGGEFMTAEESDQNYETFEECWSKVFYSLIERAFKNAGLVGTKIIADFDDGGRFRLSIFISNPTKTAVKLELSVALQQIMGFARNQLTDGSAFITNAEGNIDTSYSAFIPNLDRGISSMWIYCDIIRPQITGHLYSPLLRVIQVNPNTARDNARVERFDRPYYYPLNADDINNITITITNTGGQKPIQFASPVVCMLHFRRRN